MTIALPLTGQKFEKEDFSGQDLSKKNLSGSIFSYCNFDNADMSEANCEGSDFVGSSFHNTNMYRLNGRNAKFTSSLFEPRDCYGITLTFDCKTFQNVKIGQLWWFAVLTMWASMIPAMRPVQGPLRDNLIALIGAERYAKLKQMLIAREM